MNASNEPAYWHHAWNDPDFSHWVTRYLLCFQARDSEKVASRYLRCHPPKQQWAEATLLMLQDRSRQSE